MLPDYGLLPLVGIREKAVYTVIITVGVYSDTDVILTVLLFFTVSFMVKNWKLGSQQKITRRL
jgi:hypothetical protein